MDSQGYLMYMDMRIAKIDSLYEIWGLVLPGL